MQGLLQYSICFGFRWIIVDMGYTNLSGRWFCYCIQNKSHTHDFTYLQFWRISQNDFNYSTRSHSYSFLFCVIFRQ